MAILCNGLSVRGHVVTHGNTWEGNTGFGFCALRSTNAAQQCNTAFGHKTLYNSALSGTLNTAFGTNALFAVSSGYRNTGIGRYAGRVIGAGHQHVAVGRCALGSQTSGQNQLAIGNMANYSSTSQSYSITIGNQSKALTSHGVAIGNVACANGCFGTAIGAFSKANDSHATALGTNAWAGPYSTAIGYCARAIYDCSIAIGHAARAYNNDDIAIGMGAATNGYPPGSIMWGTVVNTVCNKIYVNWTYCSDGNEKNNIETLGYDFGLPLIKKLRPVKFNWDNREKYVEHCGFEFGQKDGTLANEKETYGLIAQELEQALTELNLRFDGLRKRGDKRYFLADTELLSPLVKSIQQLSTKLSAIKERITTLENA